MTLAELQCRGLVRHLGLSNVTSAQVAEAQTITEVVCVQNHYNLAHRQDDPLIDELGRRGIAYVPFFPLGGFTPLVDGGRKARATPIQVALAWLLARRRTSCSFPALRRQSICGRILRRRPRHIRRCLAELWKI